jgi:poly-gamma-glutamate synthesis protein (capsule biosynthesis protein)
MKLFRFLLLCAFLLSSCGGPVPHLFGPTPRPPTPRPPTTTPGRALVPSDTPLAAGAPPDRTTPSPTSPVQSLWLSPAVPAALAAQAGTLGLPPAPDAETAGYRLNADPAGDIQWIYALVAPFPTATDDVTLADLQAAWQGGRAGPLDSTGATPLAAIPLHMADSTAQALASVWGEPAAGALVIEPADQLLDSAWKSRPSWAIVPFEEIQPRWKVLSVDGQSPLRKDFDASKYALTISFSISPSRSGLPSTNRDPAKLTTVVMTGVTALVRLTAITMNVKGILYPGQEVRSVLREADIAHVSNEIPFYGGCPDPDPNDRKLVFCSPPRYIELLTDVGTDVVELTGNHFADYGPQAMEETLSLYRANNLPYYGGGENLLDARKPLLIEKNGTKFAFIGCNYPDRGKFPTASEARPGAAPCDYDFLTAKIGELQSQDYMVIMTFQYTESDSQLPVEPQLTDFRRMADAGATIVSGSQAHMPQTFEFYKSSLIHYGLGNLFFDQMGGAGSESPKRREFLDRHVFYDGHYLGTEVLTYLLEDFSRPVPMTPLERIQFLLEYFKLSGW